MQHENAGVNWNGGGDLLAPRNAAEILGVTSSGVIWLTNIGRLRCLRDAAGRRILLRADVEALAAARDTR